MARVIIDKAALEAGKPAIQVVYEPEDGKPLRENYRTVDLRGIDGSLYATMQQLDAPGQDGTRIELTQFNCVLDGR